MERLSVSAKKNISVFSIVLVLDDLFSNELVMFYLNK